MLIDVLTLFPDMFAPLKQSIIGKAQNENIVSIQTHDFRNFAVNKHGHVDDTPYGGGAGMLLRIEPLVHQLEALENYQKARVILVTPTGKQFTQEMAHEWAEEDHLIFICGHYEGFDERIHNYVTDEVSIGDYVLTNGEIPAMAMIDSTVRLIPNVVGNAESIVQESHHNNLLEHPQYTRPREFRGQAIPDVLASGDHAKIASWQHKEALRRTYLSRPDMLKTSDLSAEDEKILDQIKLEENV